MKGKYELEKKLHEVLRDIYQCEQTEKAFNNGIITFDEALEAIANHYRAEMNLRQEKHYLCRHCLEAIRSRGEKVDAIPVDYFETDEETLTCTWCEEEYDISEMYEWK